MADNPRAASWRLVAALGVTQIVSWGTMYYAFSLMIDAFAGATHIARNGVVGAFSVALLVTGLASAPVGGLIGTARSTARWRRRC